MGTKKVSIRYLIDVAIGSPEPGIVNFNALYTVLQSISEKLDLLDENIEIDSYYCPVANNTFDSKSNVSSERLLVHQVYDTKHDISENPIPDKKPTKDTSEVTSTWSASIQETQVEDRKVGFHDIDGHTYPIQSPKKSKDAERHMNTVRQHIDVLNARLCKIENVLVTSTDTEQSVDCLRQIVNQFQDKIDLLNQKLDDVNEKRYIQDQDISACRKKMEHDKITAVTDDIKLELAELREAIGKTDPSSKPIPWHSIASPASEDLSELRNEFSKFKNQMLEVKGNLCILQEQMEKIHRTSIGIKPTTEDSTLNVFEQEMSMLKEYIERTSNEIELIQTEHKAQKNFIEELINKMDDVTTNKIDKEEVDELLSEKADYTMLHRKVSVEALEADRRKLEEEISEISECVILNEDRVQKQIGEIKKFLGDQSLEDLLYVFKVKVDKEIQGVRDAINRLAEMKPEADSATTRLKDLSCLACDQDVVMKAVEVNNLTKLADAYVSKSINPLVTHEVGNLREAAKFGPAIVGGTLSNIANNLRHSGGVHTIITSNDRVAKTRSKRRK